MLWLSSFTRLVRVAAYCLQWLPRARKAGFLTKKECINCIFCGLCIAQQLEFPEEYLTRTQRRGTGAA